MSMTGMAKSFCVVGEGHTSTGAASEADASGNPPSPIKLPLLPPPLLLEEEPPDEPPLLPVLPPPSPWVGVPCSNPDPPERFPQEYEKKAARHKAQASAYDQRRFMAATLWLSRCLAGQHFCLWGVFAA
jgi:hypothetical protein